MEPEGAVNWRDNCGVPLRPGELLVASVPVVGW